MSEDSIGVAVIGAGMAGRAHAAGYRSATTLFGEGLPEVRLVAVADVNEQFATQTARRFGYTRPERSWEAIAEADDVDVVSVVVANHLHREVVEGCSPQGSTCCARSRSRRRRPTPRRWWPPRPGGPTCGPASASPSGAPRDRRDQELVDGGSLGRPIHVSGHYRCDYAVEPTAPMSWRYKGGPGSGALADIGSHLVDLAEFLCWPIASSRGTTFATTTTERALPLGAAVGHAAASSATCANPSTTRTSSRSRRPSPPGDRHAVRLPRGHGAGERARLRALRDRAAATFDLSRPGEIGYVDRTVTGPTAVCRRPDRPRAPLSEPLGYRWTCRGWASGEGTC